MKLKEDKNNLNLISMRRPTVPTFGILSISEYQIIKLSYEKINNGDFLYNHEFKIEDFSVILPN